MSLISLQSLSPAGKRAKSTQNQGEERTDSPASSRSPRPHAGTELVSENLLIQYDDDDDDDDEEEEEKDEDDEDEDDRLPL